MSRHGIISIYGFTMDYCIMDVAAVRKVSLKLFYCIHLMTRTEAWKWNKHQQFDVHFVMMMSSWWSVRIRIVNIL